MNVNGPSNVDGVRKQDYSQNAGTPADPRIGNIPVGGGALLAIDPV